MDNIFVLRSGSGHAYHIRLLRVHNLARYNAGVSHGAPNPAEFPGPLGDLLLNLAGGGLVY